MNDEYPRITVRCIFAGHTLDFNEDLGAVAIGKGVACTPCMDQLFAVNGALHPNGERPQALKKRKKHEAFRHRQKR